MKLFSSSSGKNETVRRLCSSLAVLFALAPLHIDGLTPLDEVSAEFFLRRTPWLAMALLAGYLYGFDWLKTFLLLFSGVLSYPIAFFYAYAYLAWSISGFAP